MTVSTKSGSVYIPNSAEELAPYENWISWLKKIDVKIIKKHHLPIQIGYKYSTYDLGKY